MRETPPFEVRLHRFATWRAAVAAVALAAVTAACAWAASTASTGDADNVAWVVATALVLALATLAAALSLARVPAGVLACRDGCWTFTADSGRTVAGALTVALDWGAFFLLRIDGAARARLWLPVERHGLEREWHALRCALYTPPRAPGPPAPSVATPPE
jgi:hypothetical protein